MINGCFEWKTLTVFVAKLGGITIYVKHSEATKATLLWDGVRLKDFLIATKNASPHSIQK
jgi:hypothetical protein